MTAPAGAAEVFGDRLGQAERFAEWLVGPGIERGLLGPREAERVWSRHLFNSAALASLIAPEATVADLGSGAGLPGIPLWLARPDLRLTLIEPLQRRAEFLTEVARDLELPVRILRSRAEDVVDRFEFVVARAVAPLDRLVGWSGPLLSRPGTLLALKGSTAAEELARHAGQLRRSGVSQTRLQLIQAADGERATVVVVEFSGEVAR
jgi:16S rRNA (guanine527-N7)-methyltransferase